MQGPALRAVLEMNPSALAQAAVLDKERKGKGKRSNLHGIPILLKVSLWPKVYIIITFKKFKQDNIATIASEGWQSRLNFLSKVSFVFRLEYYRWVF